MAKLNFRLERHERLQKATTEAGDRSCIPHVCGTGVPGGAAAGGGRTWLPGIANILSLREVAVNSLVRMETSVAPVNNAVSCAVYVCVRIYVCCMSACMCAVYVFD